MSYGSGGEWGDPDRYWSGSGYDQQGGYGYDAGPSRGPSGGMIAAIVVLVVLALTLLGVVGYLVLRPSGGDAGSAGQAAPTSTVTPTTSRAPVTETEYTTEPERETVTVTRTAPRDDEPSSSGGYPPGADSSGWTDDRAARCNAGDPAAMIGRTTRSAFSICVNPDNGRYYYRGSSGGAGVEVDDPEVYGPTATVRNAGVEYVISSSSMVIYEDGRVISDQPMIEFWVD